MSLLPWLPTPMPAMTIRSLAGGFPSCPRALALITYGAATARLARFKNSRRVVLFLFIIFFPLSLARLPATGAITKNIRAHGSRSHTFLILSDST